ncbi:MAG: DUF6788 family protein [Armatimonadota bacterium]
MTKTLPKIRPLPGTVHREWKKCGKAGCRCAGGLVDQLHGPYHYRFWRDGGRLQKQYVPAADVDQVQAACRERRIFDAQMREHWRESRQDLRDLRTVLRRAQLKVRDWEEKRRAKAIAD